MSTEKIFKYGELNKEYDVSDFKQMERTEAAFAKLSEMPKSIDGEKTHTGKLRTMFYAYTDFIDSVFNDPNAANLALGESTSLDNAIDCVFAFVEFVRKQDEATAQRWTQLTKKYAPRKK